MIVEDKLEFIGIIPPSVKCFAFASSPSRVEPKLAFPLRGEGGTSKASDGRGELNLPDKLYIVLIKILDI